MKKNRVIKTTALVLVGIAAVVAAGLLAYPYLPFGVGQRVPAADLPDIVGGLVHISSTTITVKASDGKEMEFTGSSKTPVLSKVAEGEIGRSYAQLGIGDVLAVTADGRGGAKKIEIIPLEDSPSAVAKTSQTLAGMFINIQASSSLVLRLTSGDPITLGTLAAKTVQLTAKTALLQEVLGGQIGKPLSSFVPGTAVTVTGQYDKDTFIAREVVFLPNRQ